MQVRVPNNYAEGVVILDPTTGDFTKLGTVPDVSVSSAYESARQAKAVAANLISINGYNSKATAQFIQIHNSAAAAAEGAAPVDFFVAPAQSAFFYQPNGDVGDAYSTGIYVCNSSTGPTKTLGSADCWFRVRAKNV